MLDLLWLMLASVPAGIGLYSWAEWLWNAIEKRDRTEWHSLRPLSSNPTEEKNDAEILL
jgi:hypothetical protein